MGDHVAPPAYTGVRMRQWGKWVTEILGPGKKKIWLGTYETAEMAAVAYDVAAWYLRGRTARLNFPELVETLPRPASPRTKDIKEAAQSAALRLRRPIRVSETVVGDEPRYSVPVTVSLSPREIQAIRDSPLYSPMSMQMAAEDLLFKESMVPNYDGVGFSDFEEIEHDSNWDS
ncbi:hypothetical protein UlMin_028349 [Ulmus minor]